MSRWKWIRHEGEKLYDIGLNDDGTLHNPNGYPAETVRAVIAGAEQRAHERASKATKKAAETRRRRHDKLVYDVARRIVAGERYGPRTSCYVCGRGLDDPQSIQRGVGPECWQGALDLIEAAP